MRSPMLVLSLVVGLSLTACEGRSKAPPPPPVQAAAPADGALRLGAAIEASAQVVALRDVAKEPRAYVGKTFATAGTVTAVCQHRGCWMELEDDAGEAHVKMAGHAFFVPRTASGHRARVLARLVDAEAGGSCEGEGHDGQDTMAAAGGGTSAPVAKKGCRAEAEAQLGRPIAKLELVAEGVELM